MSGLIDLHRPAPVIGLTGEEIAVITEALRHRQAELTGQRNFYDRVRFPDERDAVNRQLLMVKLVRHKLGDGREENQS